MLSGRPSKLTAPAPAARSTTLTRVTSARSGKMVTVSTDEFGASGSGAWGRP